MKCHMDRWLPPRGCRPNATSPGGNSPSVFGEPRQQPHRAREVHHSAAMASLILAACGGFLIAVLWMDLMFDVQVLRYRESANLPEPVLASIAAYYHRVTISARPMGHLVGAMMAVALVTLAVELAAGGRASWIPLTSLVVVVGPI